LWHGWTIDNVERISDMGCDHWKATDPAGDTSGAILSEPETGSLYGHPRRVPHFEPGDRVRNTVYNREGVVVDDEDTGLGTVAVRYNDSSQVWYVLPFTLVLVSRGEDE
jgi:hypothetical protein